MIHTEDMPEPMVSLFDRLYLFYVLIAVIMVCSAMQVLSDCGL